MPDIAPADMPDVLRALGLGAIAVEFERMRSLTVAAATAHVAQSAATATASAARVVDEVETFVRILESAEVPRVTSAPMAPAQADNATNAGSSQR